MFDADVLIGLMNASDAHHQAAREWMVRAGGRETRRWICAVNLSEVLVGPIREGRPGVVDELLVDFSVETVAVDKALAERAAAVRARSGLKIPDAYALATALSAEQRGHRDVELASFDDRVLKAYADYHTG